MAGALSRAESRGIGRRVPSWIDYVGTNQILLCSCTVRCEFKTIWLVRFQSSSAPAVFRHQTPVSILCSK